MPPTQHKFDSGNLLTWAGDLEENTMLQARHMAEMPFVHGHAALMADAHLGYGVPIGAVIPTLGAIMPAAVGVDIGCGMIAVQTDLTAANLPDSLDPLLTKIGCYVPAGVGQGHTGPRIQSRATVTLDGLGDWKAPIQDDKNRVPAQLGSLGSGNHFVEICLDDDETVWAVLHSGSRGIGNRLARHHIDHAKGLMKDYFISLPDPDLAYLAEGTQAFDDYIYDLRWAQNYALANREIMMDSILYALEVTVGEYAVTRRINCHHNYTEQEHHFGKDVWVTRKGAIRARVGDWGVIPGSMGTSSYIVKGLGSKASLNSASHGAGRTMSRKQAKKTLTLKSFAEAMEGRTWLDDKAASLLDEHPAAYKDIHQVMANQADLVKIVCELTAILNYKGT